MPAPHYCLPSYFPALVAAQSFITTFFPLLAQIKPICIMHLSTIIALVAAPLVVLAAPGRLPIPNLAASAVHPIPNFAGCRVDNATLSDLPTGQTTIAVPAGQTPVNIAMGVGVQNYTCTNGTFASVSSPPSSVIN